MTITETTTCPACGASARGRFCSSCGNPLANAHCASCGGPLAAGARFCHHCGSAVTNGPSSPSSLIPWAVGVVALVALTALVLAQRMGSGTVGEAVASPLRTATPVIRGPDLSAMTPRERADRLFNRVMSYQERGVTDSVQFFADMGVRAFQMLPSLDNDARYDIGRLAEAAGNAPLAKAQSDTILQTSPTHLLGLILGARAARLTNDRTAARTFDRRLVAAEAVERRKALPEYERHAADIDEALRIARQAP